MLRTCAVAARRAARPQAAAAVTAASSASPSSVSVSCSLSLSSFSTSSSASAAADTTCKSPTEFGVYPGNKKIRYVPSLDAHPPNSNEPMPCYRVMEEDGSIRADATTPTFTNDSSSSSVSLSSTAGSPDAELDQDAVLKMYTTMVRLQTMDTVFFDAQRQGRISFYMTNWGEEGTHIGTAMALKDDDEIFAQYREAGVLMWRGFTLQNFADQCFSNKDDLGKGRQMPVHYGSANLHFQTISSPLATQIPQAAGAAYACKLEGKGRVVACYFGDGAASEGDFHAALNMAATLQVPAIFVCRNNGFAISTPVAEQYRGDGIAARGIAYGIHTMRVDGNDVFAVRAAMTAARAIASGSDGSGATKPVLLECMTYREGHHSTSDDSTRYRSPDEIKSWRETANPVRRLRRYMERRGWWNQEKEDALVATERKAVLQAMTAAERKPKPPALELIHDVYHEVPLELQRQYDDLQGHVAKYPQHYSSEEH